MARGRQSVRVQRCDRTNSVLAILAHSTRQPSRRQEHELRRASLRQSARARSALLPMSGRGEHGRAVQQIVRELVVVTQGGREREGGPE